MVLPYKSPRELQCTSSLSYSLLSLINQHINLIKFPVFFSVRHTNSILYNSYGIQQVMAPQSCIFLFLFENLKKNPVFQRMLDNQMRLCMNGPLCTRS